MSYKWIIPLLLIAICVCIYQITLPFLIRFSFKMWICHRCTVLCVEFILCFYLRKEGYVFICVCVPICYQKSTDQIFLYNVMEWQTQSRDQLVKFWVKRSKSFLQITVQNCRRESRQKVKSVAYSVLLTIMIMIMVVGLRVSKIEVVRRGQVTTSRLKTCWKCNMGLYIQYGLPWQKFALSECF